MKRSQFQVDIEPPNTYWARVASHLRWLLEPLAHRLVDWCHVINGRVEEVSRRVDSLGSELERRLTADSEAHEQAVEQAREASERRDGLLWERLDQAEGRFVPLEERFVPLEERAEALYWGREALVERINAEQARVEIILGRIDALDEEADRLSWGREALVERLNASDARAEHLVRRLERLTDRVDEHVPMPLAFAMDAMAMGRRLAALEDQVERLTRQLGEARDDPGVPSVVAFPGQDKAAG